MHLELLPTSLARLFAEVEQIFSYALADKGLSFAATIDTKVPALLALDEARMRQVLLNVVGNAIKFTSIGGVEVQACCAPCADTKCVRLQIEIADTGIGVADSQREIIFESFEQGRQARQSRLGGAGLGLAICRRLLQMMGGDISVRARAGGGSVFCVTIDAVEMVESAPAALPASADAPIRKETDDPGAMPSQVVAPALLAALNGELLEAWEKARATSIVNHVEALAERACELAELYACAELAGWGD